MRGWRVRSVPKRLSSTKALGSPRRTLSQHKRYRVVTAPRTWGRSATPYPSRRSKVPRSSTYPPLRAIGATQKIEADCNYRSSQNNHLILTAFRFAAWNRAMKLRFGLVGTRRFAEAAKRRNGKTSHRHDWSGRPPSKATRYPGTHETHINGGYDNGD